MLFFSSWTSLSYGYLFNKTYHVSECWFIQKISSFFSLSVLCTTLFWNLGFFISQNMFLVFWWTKAIPYVSSSPRNKRQLLCVLTLWWTNGNKLIFHSLKICHMLIFFCQALPQYQIWSRGLLLYWCTHG